MKTINVEKTISEEGFSFVVKCKKCGAWLAKANRGMGLDQRNYFNYCICGEQADGREIDEAWMQFKQDWVGWGWTRNLTRQIVEARGDQPTEWLVRCARCDFEIKNTFCDPATIAAQIINEQWRWNCIDPGRIHDFLL